MATQPRNLTLNAAREAARAFVADYVRAGRQWSTRTLEGYLPRGWGFPAGADYAGPGNVAGIARFIHREARRS